MDDLIRIETLRFEFYAYDLPGGPIFHAKAETDSGRTVTVGCLQQFYPFSDHRTERPDGWYFWCGDPKLGLPPPDTRNYPRRPSSDEAARDLYDYVKYYVDYYRTQGAQTQ